MAKRHGMHTEASHRFERGCDPEAVLSALDRAASLILSLCPDASVARGQLDVYPEPIPVNEVSLRQKRLLQVSGFQQNVRMKPK